MKVAGKTDIGLVRESNQDSFTTEIISDDCCFAVLCDGIGGHNGGKIASQLACFAAADYIKEYCADFGVPENIEALLKEAVSKANGVVFSNSLKNEEYKGMGSTIVLLFFKDGTVHICHLGDSRVYLINDKKAEQLTKDHSVVQELLDNGELTEEETLKHPLKNIIIKAVGIPEKIEGDYRNFLLPDNATVLLCSDGLSSYVDIEKIIDPIDLYGATEECCDRLISLANESGGKDNVTVVLFDNRQ